MGVWRGVWVDDRTEAMCNELDRLVGAIPLHPSQGSRSAGAQSGGTHSGDGAVDFILALPDGRVLDDAEARQIEYAGRSIGFFASYRPAIPNIWPRHVHMIAAGCPGLSTAAAEQILDYAAGGDGLLPRDANGRSVNRDTGPRQFVGVTWESYLDARAGVMAHGAAAALPSVLLDRTPPAPTTPQESPTMKLIQAPARGIALVGPDYFRTLVEGEEVDEMVKLYGWPVVGNDREFDVWRSVLVGPRPDPNAPPA